MLISYKRGQGSIVLRVKILDSTVSTGAGKTGLAYNTSGLIISTIADNEASATVYTVAGSTIETISTLGTYAAPSATKCRFKELDATNHPGVYEIQIADARFAVASAKSLIVSVLGATGAAQCDVCVPLVDLDPYDAVRAGLTGLPNHVMTTGTVSADAGNTASTFKTNLSATEADHWKYAFLTFTSGTLAGQTRQITAYNGSTKFVTTVAFSAAPTAADAFLLVNR